MTLVTRALRWLVGTTTARVSLVLSVAVHGVVAGTIGARAISRAPEPAPVDPHADLLFVIAETTPVAAPPPTTDLPVPTAAPVPRATRRGSMSSSQPRAHASASPPVVSATTTIAGGDTAPAAPLLPSTAPSEAVAAAAEASPGPTGAGASSGAATSPPPNEPDPGNSSVDLAEYGRTVHSRIVAQVRFPERAARESIEGTVLVELLLDGGGHLVRASIVGDAHAVLREAALEAANRAAPFPPPPRRGGGGTTQIAFQIPLRFFLRRLTKNKSTGQKSRIPATRRRTDMRVLRPWLTFSLALTAACSTGTPVTSRGGSTATSANTTPPPPNPPPVHQAADIPPASPLPMAADETYDLSKDEARIGKLARTELGERVAIETVEGVFVFVCAPSWSGASCRGSVDFLSRALVALRNHRFDRLPSRAVGVYLFGDDTTYERYCKDTWKAPCISPYGFYSPTERRLVMNLGLGVGTLTHEIVHPLVEADFPGAPTWIDEGIASLFEAPLMAARGEIHGAKNWRYPKLAARLRGEHPVRLDDLFGMSGETFRNEEESVHYALARYVCQWLDSRGELWSFYRAWRDGIVSDPTGEKSFTKTVGMTPAEANDEFSRWARRL